MFGALPAIPKAAYLLAGSLHDVEVAPCRLSGDCNRMVTGDKMVQNEIGGACSAYVGEVYTGLRWGNLRKIDPGIDRRIILRWMFMKWDGRAWTELVWLRIRIGGGLL